MQVTNTRTLILEVLFVLNVKVGDISQVSVPIEETSFWWKERLILLEIRWTKRMVVRKKPKGVKTLKMKGNLKEIPMMGKLIHSLE